VTHLKAFNSPQTGCTSVTILGVGVGAARVSGSSHIRGGGSASETVKWTSSTSVMCRIASVVASSSTRIVGSVGLGARDLIGTNTKILTFDKPAGVPLPPNAPTTGSISITLKGSGFGLLDNSHRLRLGGSAGMASAWGADSALRLRVPSGVLTFVAKDIAITQSLDLTSSQQCFTYNGHHFTQQQRVNVPAAGGTTMTVFGSGMTIAPSATPAVRVDGTAGLAMLWTSDSSIASKTPAGYFSTSHLVVVTGAAGGSQGVTMTKCISYDKVSVSSIYKTNVAATGSQSVTVLGENFIIRDYSSVIRFADTTASTTKWMSVSALIGKLGVAAPNIAPAVHVTVLKSNQISEGGVTVTRC